jgi:hypothetical protein
MTILGHLLAAVQYGLDTATHMISTSAARGAALSDRWLAHLGYPQRGHGVRGCGRQGVRQGVPREQAPRWGQGRAGSPPRPLQDPPGRLTSLWARLVLVLVLMLWRHPLQWVLVPVVTASAGGRAGKLVAQKAKNPRALLTGSCLVSLSGLGASCQWLLVTSGTGGKAQVRSGTVYRRHMPCPPYTGGTCHVHADP